VVAPAATRPPSKALLPRIVVPDASLARVAHELPQKFAFFSTAEDAAASTPDPKDTGADLMRLGRIAGYVRGRNARGAFSPRPPNGLLTVGTSAILWRDARSAAASIKRDMADDKRFRGKRIQGALLVSFAATKVVSLGSEGALLHIHTRRSGADQFTTQVVFRVESLRGNVVVARSDSRNADATALDLAKQLTRRMLKTLRK